ncbi:MAG: YHYH protein [Algibacter sp.]
MKKRCNINIIGFFIIGVLFSCHSNKGTNAHSHNENDGHSHAHEAESISQEHNDYFGTYNLEDENFGTKTSVTIKGDKRIMITNSLPDHKTGEFPRKGNPNTISAQNKTYSFPLHPKYTGESRWVREPGIALNGVKFEPGTAEVVKCDTGENYRVEAFQELINLGLDFNHAHVQPTGAYHYHGTPTSVIENFDTGEDLVHVGFAHDGFPMYYSKSHAYKPSYKLVDGDRDGEDCTYSNPKNTIDISVGGHHDGTYSSDFEYVDGFGDLDECNGITIDGKYLYLVTSEFPYISRCLMGEFTEEKRKGRPGQEGGRRERPSIAQVFSYMDVNNDGKLSAKELKGPFADDFSKIDVNNNGFISKEEIEKVSKKRPQS